MRWNEGPPESYRFILDRIGKAARRGERDRMLAEAWNFRIKLFTDLRHPVRAVRRMLS